MCLIDFGIITAIKCEKDAMLSRMASVERIRGEDPDIRDYFRGSLTLLDGSKYELVVVQCNQAGNSDAGQAAKDLIIRWNPANIIMVGIAGGYPRGDLKIGDVVIATEIIEYDYGRFYKDDWQPRPRHHPISALLLAKLTSLPSWQGEEITISHENHKETLKPKVHKPGPIAAGNALFAEPKARDRLLTIQQDLLALEMESEGVATAAWQRNPPIPVFVVRGISDLADSKTKGEVPEEIKRKRQKIASNSATSFLIHFLLDQPVKNRNSPPTIKKLEDPKSELNNKQIGTSQLAQSNANIDQPRHPPSLHFITPPDHGFVGREEFLSEISAWYEAGQVRVGALVGLGGIGKSSIARKWFDKLRDQAAYVQKIFWWGFYQNTSLDECLNCLLEYISDERISPAEYDRPIDKINMIKTSLHHQECLVIFDGFEAVQMRSAVGSQDAGDAVYNYLGELLKSFAESTGRTFLLVTTRYGLDELRGYKDAQYREIEIKRLALEDAITLFKKSDIRAENHEVETVWREFEGHALSLRLLTTFLQEYYDGNIHAIQEIPALTSDELKEYRADEVDGGKARRILVWYDSKLGEEQRVFLKIFSLFAKPVTQKDFLSVFQTKDERLRNDSLVSLSNIAFANLIKKLTKLHLLTTRKEDGTTIYETHPLIKEYFSSLVGKEAPTWHQALTGYYESTIFENDYDLVLRDQQIIHHALRSKKYQSAIEASRRLLPYLKDSISQTGTIGLIRLYHVTSAPLTGTKYREVYKKACRTYKKLRGGETQWIHIRSAYFDNEEVDFDFFWDRVSKKSFKEKTIRVRLLPCAIELIRNSRIEPFSIQDTNRPFEIIHRFLGITRSNVLFFVHINEDTKTDKKYFMSVFPARLVHVPLPLCSRKPHIQHIKVE